MSTQSIFTYSPGVIAPEDNGLILPQSGGLVGLERMDRVYQVVQGIVANLDEAGLLELSGGNMEDVEGIFDALVNEAYGVLYGNTDANAAGIITDIDGLEALSRTTDEAFSIESLSYFISSKIPEFDLEWYHFEWSEFVQLYNRLCILASRDGGKSYFFSMALLAWKLWRYKKWNGYDLNPRKDLELCRDGMLVTADQDLGIDLLEILKNTIENNDPLKQRLFPEGRLDVNWKSTGINAKNGARVRVRSYNARFRGRHPDYFVFDDLLDDNVLYSPTQRTKTNDRFFSVFINSIKRHNPVTVVGTPMHEADLYGVLKQSKQWNVFEYPAIFPDGRLLNESRYNFQDLMDIREEQGSLLFARERLVPSADL
jgi:hypothetical protein